jgi:hemerythrin superfamily protein
MRKAAPKAKSAKSASARAKSKGSSSKTGTDAIALLKADHRKVEDLFEKYEKSRSKKADIARQICIELTVHTTIEEELLYPACEGAVEKDLVDEAYVEHDSAKLMMAELESGAPDDDYYDAKVKVLAEEVKHHIKEEEKPGGLFSQLRDSDIDLKVLGDLLAARKQELLNEISESGLPPPMTRTLTAGKIERMQVAEQPAQM